MVSICMGTIPVGLKFERALLRWVILSERDEFKLSPPGRIRFFRHLMKSYSYNGALMTWRIRAVNYFNAIGALIVGYKHFPILEKNREKATRWLRGRVTGVLIDRTNRPHPPTM